MNHDVVNRDNEEVRGIPRVIGVAELWAVPTLQECSH